MPLSTRETGDADKVEITTLDGSRPARQSAGVALPGIVTLAGWRVHQTWRLLLITGIGILAAVMLVCVTVVPGHLAAFDFRNVQAYTDVAASWG